MRPSEEETVAELAGKHSTEEIAESLYRAFGRAALCADGQGGEPPAWDGLSLDHQQGFLVLARQGPGVLQQLEGQPLAKVAHQLYLELGPGRVMGDHFHELPAPGRLLWEMVARHLALLMDCDEAQSLAEAEDVMLDFYRRKLQP